MTSHETFSDYLAVENILCGVSSADGRTVLDLLISEIQEGHPYLNTLPALNEIEKREESFSTVIMPGLALPHARIPGLGEPVAAVACSPEGFSFFSAQQKVHVMVLLLSPEDEPDLHLRVMAALAEGLSGTGSIELLAGMTTPENVISYFRDHAPSLPGELSVRNLMVRECSTLHEKESLSAALVRLTQDGYSELPVVSAGGCLLGVLSLKELMCSLSAEELRTMLREKAESPVIFMMNRQCCHVHGDLLAIQLIPFFRQGVEIVYVTDELERPIGLVNVRTFFSGFFRE